MANILKDQEFQKILLGFICRDRQFLKDTGYLLSPDDFKPISKSDDRSIWTIAKLALEHYNKTREPIGPLLRILTVDHADNIKLGEKQTEKLLDVVNEINEDHREIISVDTVAEKVIQYKKTRLKKLAVERAMGLMEKGELTDDAWLNICQQGVQTFSSIRNDVIDYFDEYEERIKRREYRERVVKYPLTLIDPLDSEVRTITRGQSGVILALLKYGKSTFGLWFAVAYAFQGIDSLLFTLEDGEEITTNRLDAMLTGMFINELNENSEKFRRKFKRIRRFIHGKIRIIDGTGGGYSVARMEDTYEKFRNQGFTAGASFCDYDEEVDPPVKYGKDPSARRLELSDIHREYRRFIARRGLLGWMLAQTNRKAEDRKWITLGMVGEDISKIKKTHCCVGIGAGDWGENSRFVQIVASKTDKQHVGWNIMTDYSRGIAYDREATLSRMRKEEKRRKRDKD